MLAFVIELFTIVGFASLSDASGGVRLLFGALAGIAWAFPFLAGQAPRSGSGSRSPSSRTRGGDGAMFARRRRTSPNCSTQRRFRRICLRRELGSLLAGDRRRS